MVKLYGKYRGIVLEGDDPHHAGRLLVQSPALRRGVRRSGSAWATACVPPGHWALPAAGDTVWIEFEEGEVSRPLWTGCAWSGNGGTSLTVSLDGSGMSIAENGTVEIRASARVEVVAPMVQVTAPSVEINASRLHVSGVVDCETLVARTGVVAPSYTPGVGNVS